MTALDGPPRCGMCEEPPSRSGPVMQLGPDGEYVDMGHADCFERARDAVRAQGRAERARA